jgi:DNA-binding transcriptional ArsR family regulator
MCRGLPAGGNQDALNKHPNSKGGVLDPALARGGMLRRLGTPARGGGIKGQGLFGQEVEMDSTRRNPREMSDEEVAKWMRELVAHAAEEKGCAGAVGTCSMEAFRNPFRRDILKALGERALEIEELSERVGLSWSALKFHLNFLQNSSFIELDGDTVDLTPGGVSFVRST